MTVIVSINDFSVMIRTLIVLSVSSLVAVAVILLLSTSPRDGTAPDRIPHQSPSTWSEGRSPTSAEPISIVGTVLPIRLADLLAPVDSVVTGFDVRLGDRVGRGQILAGLEAPSIGESDVAIAEFELAVAEASLGQVQAELRQAGTRLGRATALREQQLISTQQLDDSRYEHEVAQARLRAAAETVSLKRAGLKQRRLLVSSLQVRAPFDGAIAAKYVDNGATISRGALLLRMVDNSRMKLRFAIPISQAFLIRPGSSVYASIDGIDVVAHASITEVSSEVDPDSQLLIAEAELQTELRVNSEWSVPIVGRAVRVYLTRPIQSVLRQP